ncbi:MAG: spore coat associated protein CotJA [Clostridia bacterium]|nr:spore coat associated protein CotJA [Clostridia bacterium]
MTACDGTTRPTAPATTCRDCPTTLSAPALAMVYAPRQCWRNLFDPALGLSHGTIFKELVLPLEVIPSPHHSKEVKTRRPLL